jgi:hypothetical protein
MKLHGYIDHIDLGEDEDGRKNVLVKRAEELQNVPPTERAWATVKDAAGILDINPNYLYQLTYKGRLRAKNFKKNQSDRWGITLIPLDEALDYEGKRQPKKGPYGKSVYPYVVLALKNCVVGGNAPRRLVIDLLAIIDKQTSELGRFPTSELLAAYHALRKSIETKEVTKHEATAK